MRDYCTFTNGSDQGPGAKSAHGGVGIFVGRAIGKMILMVSVALNFKALHVSPTSDR